MYLGHYGLREPPFSITPDPRFVFLGEGHRDALAHLMFGITQGGGGGFVQLTGEVGTGKTTLSRLLLGQLPEHVHVALVLNPQQDPVQLLESVCEELHIDVDDRRGNTKALVDALNAHLLDAYARGLRVVLVIDEAQALPAATLEQVRLLTNLETDTQKLLQIILIGQPELRDVLAQPGLRQLAQRITARFHLTPLGAADTAGYLRHRFRVAGGQHFPFDDDAVQRIHLRSGGIPRLVNVIAERALLAGYARDRAGIDAALVEEAARETLPPADGRNGRRHPWPLAIAGIAGVAAIAVVLAALRPHAEPAPAVDPAQASAPPPAGPAPVARVDDQATDPPTPSTVLDHAALIARIRAAANAGAGGSAWQAMLAAWGLPQTEGDARAASACAPVLAARTYCTRGTSSLDRLLATGRPVLLRLDTGNADCWALLLGSDGRSARLVLDRTLVDVDHIALLRAWSGSYAAVWRASADLDPMPAQGSRGEAVDWLRERLAEEGLAAPTAPGARFDAALVGAIRRFQQARGLAVDGVAGPETLFTLSANDAGPRLARTLD